MPGPTFCTYFDSQYLVKGLALWGSLRTHLADPSLWALCLDDFTYDLLIEMDQPGVHCIRLGTLEAWEPRLLEARGNRSQVEYYWTCTPTLVAYVLAQARAGEVVAYVDSDLYFFSSPEAILAAAGEAAVMIHGHRYAPAHAHLASICGEYNVGLTAFRQDERGWAAVRWWQNACIAVCAARPQDGYFGDQKYLDDWPERFEGVHVLEQAGAGLAPWNLDNYRYGLKDGNLLVDNQPLVFYHFHDFYALSARIFWQRGYSYPLLIREAVYRPYVRCLQSQLRAVRVVRPEFRQGVRWPRWRQGMASLWHRRLVWQ